MTKDFKIGPGSEGRIASQFAPITLPMFPIKASLAAPPQADKTTIASPPNSGDDENESAIRSPRSFDQSGV